jgi:hypothetical protein
MNFDPRTEARNEAEAEKDTSHIKLLARTCACLNEMWQESDDQTYSRAFDAAWKDATELVSAVEFHGMVTQAAHEMGYSIT